MTWHAPALAGEHKDLVAVLDAMAEDSGPLRPDHDHDAIAGLTRQLAGVGVWTIGVAEALGGGGADWQTTAITFERLGRHWPGLGWAAVQAHAAARVLAELPDGLHEGNAPIAVVDASSAHVQLTRDDHGLSGTVDRVDAAGVSPYLLVLDGEDTALMVPPDALTATRVRTTGLDGALTVSLVVSAAAEDLVVRTGVDLAPVRVLLRLGAAAVASGIAGAASDDAVAYASVRRQFGDTLTAIPTVRQSLLAQATRVAAVLRTVLHGADDELQAWAVAASACDTAVGVAADALQSHGGYGYLAEYRAEQRLRDAVSLRAAADVPSGAARAGGRLVGAAPAAPSLHP